MLLKPLIISTLLCSTAFAQSASDDQSVVTYEKDYFIKYDPVTLFDMLQRVPGVQAILDANRRQGGGSGGTNQGGQQERGFGAGGDQILINNKRLSGKANNIGDTLARISASTVERVSSARTTRGLM